VISVPNGHGPEAQIHNFNSFDSIRLELSILLDAVYHPEKVAPLLDEAMETAENLLDKPTQQVRFRSVEWEFGWVAKYELQFWIEEEKIFPKACLSASTRNSPSTALNGNAQTHRQLHDEKPGWTAGR